ncbi:MAG: nuclear transport factor 2 family protein [Aureispira sp.]
MEIEKIKTTINNNYIHGAFNETNIDAFKTIFHPEFSIINIQENRTFFQFTRDMWEDVLMKRKENQEFDYSSIALSPVYKNINVVEKKASVTLELWLNDNMVYTDFLLLIKIDNDWKIVSKIYHEY